MGAGKAIDFINNFCRNGAECRFCKWKFMRCLNHFFTDLAYCFYSIM